MRHERHGDQVACHDCGLVMTIEEPPSGHKAICPRCGKTLFRSAEGVDQALAFNITALLLFVAANVFPFITFEMEGRAQTGRLLTGVYEFFRQGFWELGVLVGLVMFVFPLAKIVGTLYVLYPLRRGLRLPHQLLVFRWIDILAPWSMLEVFMMGVIVAYVKLADYASVEMGVSLYAFGALILMLAAGDASIPMREVWNTLGPSQGRRGEGPVTRRLQCHVCDYLLMDAEADSPEPDCPRCGIHMHHRKPDAMTRCAALVMAGIIFYIPANIYPVMTVTQFGRGYPDTIMSGVIKLIEANMWPLALIIFVASIMVPVLKLIGLAFLMISVKMRSNWAPRRRTQLYRVIEAIGRWSMIDVFMVAILIALVRLGKLANVEPGIGVSSFAIVVVITMFASHAFDPRLIWDRMEK